MGMTATDDGREFMDPVEEAKGLADSFAIMACQALDSSGGMNERRYTFLAKSYQLAIMFTDHPSDYQRLKNEEFWKVSQLKPNGDCIIRWVLYFTMRATSEQVRNRAIKAVTVLESFRAEGVPSTDVVRRLTEGHGVENIYNQICATAKAKKSAGDDIERGSAATGDSDEGTSGSPPIDAFEAREDEQADSSVAGRTGRSETAEDAPLGAPGSMHAPRRDMDGDEVEIEALRKVGPLNRIDRKTDFVVTMDSECELAESLGAKRGTINFIVRPPDPRGWRRVVVHSRRLFHDVDGPWPDLYAEACSTNQSGPPDAGVRTGSGQALSSAQSPSEMTVERSGPVNPIVWACEQSLTRVGKIVPQSRGLPPPS